MLKKCINVVVSILLILSMSTGQIMIISADDTYDNTAPILKKITIENNSKVTSKSKMKINIDIEEEGLGVTNITLQFKGKKNGKQFVLDYVVGEKNDSGGENEVLFTGSYSLIFDLTEHNLAKDDYYIERVTMRDANDNELFSNAEDDEIWTKKSTMYFSVISSDITDVSAPIVKSFKIENSNNLEWGKIYNIEIELEEETGVSEIEIEYTDGDFNYVSFIYETQVEKITNGKYILKFSAGSNCDKKGTYYLASIRCVDKYNNWGNTPINNSNRKNFTTEITVAKLQNEGVNQPEILSAEITNKKITLPNVIDLKLDVKTYNTTIDFVSVTMYSSNGKPYDFNVEMKSKLKTGVHHVKIPVSPYLDSLEYTITNITVFSDYGITSYSHNHWITPECTENCTLNKILKDASITIESPYEVSYYGSISNVKTVVKKINKLESGQIAVLDYTYDKIADKSIFEAIAGKNITVVFQCEDLQWIFTGKNIKKKRCKDINLETKISRAKGTYYGFANDKYVLKAKFADNGQLPGKVQIRINTSYLSAKYEVDEDLILSYLNKSPEVLDKKVKVEKDGFAEIEISHNSTYILSDKMPRLVSPSKFKAKKKSNTSIKLTWNKVYRADGYVIYRATSKKGKYKKIKTIKGYKTVKYVDKKLKKGKRYYYRLKAISKRKGIKSVYSKKVFAKTK